MEALEFALMCASNIVCVIIGTRLGQKVTKGEMVELPNPAKAVREHKMRVEADRIRGEYETLMQNIDNYNGTSHNQKDVPKG